MSDQQPPNPLHEAIDTWWDELKEDRGSNARLRRAGDVVELTLEHGTIDLGRRLASAAPDRFGLRHDGQLRRYAVCAGVLAAATDRAEGQQTFASQLAHPASGASRPRMSGLRFRRLLRCRDEDELLRSLRRAVHLVDATVALHSVAEGILFWGDRVRQHWALDYYTTADQLRVTAE